MSGKKEFQSVLESESFQNKLQSLQDEVLQAVNDLKRVEDEVYDILIRSNVMMSDGFYFAGSGAGIGEKIETIRALLVTFGRLAGEIDSIHEVMRKRIADRVIDVIVVAGLEEMPLGHLSVYSRPENENLLLELRARWQFIRGTATEDEERRLASEKLQVLDMVENILSQCPFPVFRLSGQSARKGGF